MVVPGGQAKFKDAPFYAPAPSSPMQMQAPTGYNLEVEYAVATPCSVCNCSGQVGGSGNGSLNSVHFNVSLGTLSTGLSAGQLVVVAAQISNQLYSTSAWSAVVPTSPEVQLVKGASGNLLQVKTPYWLADLVQTSPTICDVNIYLVSQITGPNSETQRYPISGSPFVTYEAAEPAGDNGSGNQVIISEIRGSVVKQTAFSNYSSSTGSGVSMSLGVGYGSERISQGTNGTTVTEVRDTADDGGNVIRSKTTIYTLADFGKVAVSKSVSTGSGTPPLLTQYSYYTNAALDGAAYGHLKQVLNADGSWEYYTYDVQGRVSQILRPFMDSAPTTVAALCRATATTYLSLPDADGDGIPETLIQTVDTVLGTEVGRSYVYEPSNTLVFDGDTCLQISSIRCVTPGAAWNANGNLVTKTFTFSGGTFDGDTRAVFNPDGTATLTSLILDGQGNSVSTVKTGQLNGAMSDVNAGTMGVTVTNLTSNSVVSVTTSDIASGLRISSWTATQTDQWGRPTAIAYSDGTTDTRTYACCGLGSETDKEGITTSYNYNLAGRLISTTRAGVTTLNGYDAAGRLITVTRQGADGSRIVQQTNTYDLAGRKTLSIDAVGRNTTYAQSLDGSNESVKSIVNSDGGSQTTINASDGSPLKISGTAVTPLQYQYGVDTNGYYTQTIRVGSAGQTTEWVKNYVDMAGRPSLTLYPDGSSAQNAYNSLGQLSQSVDPDGVSTLYAYDGQGRQTTVAVDMDRNGSIDYSGTDRITSTMSLVTTDHGTTVQQTTTSAWTANNAGTTQVLSVNETSANGTQIWQTANGLTTTTQIAYNGAGSRTETTTTPDGVQTTSQYSNDLITSKTVVQPSIGTLSSTGYGYDAHNRLQTSTDGRNGATIYAYYPDDKIQTSTTPNPNSTGNGSGNAPELTSYAYDSGGRVSLVTQPDGTTVSNSYFPTGLLQKTYGSRTYNQEYTYDSQGRVGSLTTWTDFASNRGAAQTTWTYDPARGWLTSKIYADSNGPSYSYWPSGRLKTRLWARGTKTIYSYGNGGDLASITYSDSTPGVSMTYNRLGQLWTVSDAAGTCTYTYDPSGQLQNETYGTNGLLAGFAVTRGFDSMDRLGSLSLGSGPSETYGYDAASRLQTVASGAAMATYTYLDKSNLIGNLMLKNAGATRLTTVRNFDNLNRLSSVTSTPSGGAAIIHSYSYNLANQRTQLTREDGSYWQYGYDALGQVNSSTKNLQSGSPINGYSFTATFDDIGNRVSTTVNKQPFTFTANSLNQYSQRTVPGIIDVIGTANPNAIVTANFQRATQQGSIFYDGLTVDNAGGPQFLQINVEAVANNAGPNGEDAIMQATRTAFLPQTPEAYTYDLDGNLLSDGRWAYTWDGENRLIGMQTLPTAVTAKAPNQRISFAYDSQGRRVQKTLANGASGSFPVVSDMRFVYDGWNLLGEFNGLGSDALVRSYVWGLDLSGTFQGAGGVGGLLEFSDAGSGTAYYAAPDGNGNVAGLVSSTSGSIGAAYEYGAFGETTQVSGVAAAINPFRFSTKYVDAETDYSYYGQRYYSPSTGRWLSRDPFVEKGGVNLYGFLGNAPTLTYDSLGLSPPEGYNQVTPGDLADLKARRYGYILNHSGDADYMYDGEWNPGISTVGEGLGCSCQASGKYFVKKILNVSSVATRSTAGAWQFLQQEAFGNYFGFNAAKSVWTRNTSTTYRSIDNWHFLEEFDCCCRGQKMDRYAETLIAQLWGNVVSQKNGSQVGYGGFYTDGGNYNVYPTPPDSGPNNPLDEQAPNPPTPPNL